MLSSFSLISLIGVMLGVLALVVVMAVFAGLERNVKQRYLDALPHILLMRSDRMPREEADESIKLLKHLPHVESATPYVADNVVIDANTFNRPKDAAEDISSPKPEAAISSLISSKSAPPSRAR